jgi:hypothetical protein
MYGWIWRRLPGPRWLKVIESTVILGLVVSLLFGLVFPWLDQFLLAPPTLG